MAVVGQGLLIAPPTPAAAAAVADKGDQSAERLAYVLMLRGSRNTIMSGSSMDLDRARSLRRGEDGLLYARYRGAGYVIRDLSILREAQTIFRPLEALGVRQGELGSQQAAHGRRQSQLGAEQGRLGRLQARANLHGTGELDRRQEALSARQEELERLQNALERQQDALSREHEIAVRGAEERLRALIADAVARGSAQRID
jgi:hypothetical protein